MKTQNRLARTTPPLLVLLSRANSNTCSSSFPNSQLSRGPADPVADGLGAGGRRERLRVLSGAGRPRPLGALFLTSNIRCHRLFVRDTHARGQRSNGAPSVVQSYSLLQSRFTWKIYLTTQPDDRSC